MKWQPHEIKTFEDMQVRGEGLDAITAALPGRSRAVVQDYALRNGFKFPRQRLVSDKQIEQFRTMARVGHSGVAIAKAIGLTAEQTRKLAVRLGVGLRRTQRARNQIRTPIDEEAYALLDQQAARRGEPLSKHCRMILERTAYENLDNAILDQEPTRPPRPPKRNAYSVPARVVAAVPAPTPPPPTPDVACIAMDAPPPSLPPPPVSIASLGPRLEGQIGYFASP